MQIAGLHKTIVTESIQTTIAHVSMHTNKADKIHATARLEQTFYLNFFVFRDFFFQRVRLMQFNDYGVELSSAGKTKIKSMTAKYGTSMSRHKLIDIGTVGTTNTSSTVTKMDFLKTNRFFLTFSSSGIFSRFQKAKASNLQHDNRFLLVVENSLFSRHPGRPSLSLHLSQHAPIKLIRLHI